MTSNPYKIMNNISEIKKYAWNILFFEEIEQLRILRHLSNVGVLH